jgi:hypothetical protein
MLTKPSCGWTSLEIEGKKFRASYLTDIPNDCIDAFVYGLKNHRPVTIYFDGEGIESYLVCDNYFSYIIFIADKEMVFSFNKGIKELSQEFVKDIEENYEEWIYWNGYDDILLEIDLTELKELLNNG